MENNDIETLEPTEETVKDTGAVETKVETLEEEPKPETKPEPKIEVVPVVEEPPTDDDDDDDEIPRKNHSAAIVIILLLLSILALSTYIISDRLSDESKEKKCAAAPTEIDGTKDENENPDEKPGDDTEDPTKAIEDEETLKARIKDELKDEDAKTKVDLRKEVERIYSLAYNELDEGTGLTKDGEPYTEKKSEDLEIEYFPFDNKILKKYFTDQYIEKFERECVETHNDIDYLICDSYYLSSIFGVTDQGERELEVIAYNDEYILAKSKEVKGEYSDFGGELIIFKKRGNTWLIDMHQ